MSQRQQRICRTAFSAGQDMPVGLSKVKDAPFSTAEENAAS